MYKKVLLITALLLLAANNVFAQSQVVPCQLTNPDQDTLRLFPERTNYRMEFIRTDEVGDKRKTGGENLYRELEKRLGDKWDPIWETKDIPYVFYEILKGPDRIGWVFGANQGWPGADNSQLMFAFDLDERINEFYYQKLPSFEKDKIRTPQFYAQFIGLTLEHFYVHEQLKNLGVKDENLLALDMIERIQNPAPQEQDGFLKTLRGAKKVFVYVDDFKFANKIKKDEVFTRVKYLVDNKNKISLLDNPLPWIKKAYPAASRYVVDTISLKDKAVMLKERLGDVSGSSDLDVCPAYVVYKDDAYKPPFVRGIILGYVLIVPLNTQPANSAIVAVSEKGKIVGLDISKTEFAQFKGLNLVNFYAKDVLNKTKMTDEKIDKIAPIKGVTAQGKNISAEAVLGAKKALIIVDEVYLHNFFKRDEIMRKIEDYLKKSQK